MLIPQIYTLCIVLTLCSGEEKKDINVLALHSFTGKIWPGGWPCSISIQLAFDDINARTDILAHYRLVQDYVDIEDDPGLAVFRMVQKLQEKTYGMLLGPILSSTAMPTASVSHHWNITQLAFAASSSVLSNQKRYPNFYRMSAPDRGRNGARIGLMKKFGWQKIATIHYAIEYFSTIMDDFVDDVGLSNITIFTQQVFVKDPTSQIRSLKENDARIIMTAMYEDKARELLCASYNIGLYGPKIVWIFFGYYSPTFWQTHLEGLKCSAEEMANAVEGSFLIKYADTNTIEQKRGLANITYSELMERVLNHPDYKPESSPYDSICDNCFDAAWVAALALNCTVAKQTEKGHNKTLDQFEYADAEINKIIDECMAETSFLGISDHVIFQADGDPIKTVQIERVQNNERALIGYNIQTKLPHRFEWFDENLFWKDGKIPRDSTVVTEKEVIIPTLLYTIMCVFAATGIALAACLFTFNIVFRYNRSVKMSSPNINNVLLVGCILSYTVIFIKTIEVSSTIVCQIRVFCFCLGFTITFGSLFSKTWRVYKIFTNTKQLRMRIKDMQLFAIIGVLAAVVLLVLSVWEAVSPHKVVIRFLDKEFSTIGNDVEIHPYVRACHSDKSWYFGWTLYILEGLMLAFGAFLAWETRHVKIAALNDSHQIGLCLYNVVILSAVGLTLSLLLEEQEVLLYGVTSGCLLLGTTLTQLVVFIPKLQAVYKKTDVDAAAPNASTSIASQPTVSTKRNGT